MAYNPEKHHRRSIRLNGYDYSQPGDYFVTMCTQNRECIFGEIDNGKMKLNDIGQIVEDTWNDLPNHNLNIILDSFIIMPNHFHGILRIVGAGSKPAPAPVSKRTELELNRAGLEPAPTLSEIIRQFKTFSTRYINRKQNQRGISIWQRNYYEHIIRNQDDLDHIRQYIIDNPGKWHADANNPKNIKI